MRPLRPYPRFMPSLSRDQDSKLAEFLDLRIRAYGRPWRGADYRLRGPEPALVAPWGAAVGRLTFQRGIPRASVVKARPGHGPPDLDSAIRFMDGKDEPGIEYADFFPSLLSFLRHLGLMPRPARWAGPPPRWPSLATTLAEAVGITEDTARAILADGPLAASATALGEVPDCLCEAGHVSPGTWPFLAEKGAAGRRRRQFATTWPFHVDALQDARVRADVDEGRSPVRSIAAGEAKDTRHDLPSGVPLRPPGGTTVRRLGVLPPGLPCRPGELMALATLVPADWLPAASDDTGWEAVATVAASFTGHRDDLRPGHARALFRGVRSTGWSAWLDAVVQEGHDDRQVALGHALVDARDWLGSFQSTVLAPAFARAEGLPGCHRYKPPYQAVGMLAAFAVTGLRELLSLSRRWHRERAAIDRIVSAGMPAPRGGWPVPFGPWTSTGGIHMVPLRSRAELEEEGASMDHCAGDFWHRCASRACVVVSVRSGPERLATAELAPTGNRDLYRIVQLRGPSNMDPAAVAGIALHELLTAIARGEHGNQRHWSSGTGEVPAIAALCGHDPEDLAAAETLLDAWRPFLPRTLRRWSHDRFVTDPAFGCACDRVGKGFREGHDAARRR